MPGRWVQHDLELDTLRIGGVPHRSDGGVYRSPNAGVNWHSVNKGLAITEFEYLAAHPQYDAWLIGGTQDNGTERYEGGEVWFELYRS